MYVQLVLGVTARRLRQSPLGRRSALAGRTI